jgi:hypothetical protein
VIDPVGTRARAVQAPELVEASGTPIERGRG